MAAPALLRNFTIFGWRAPANVQTLSYVMGINIDANTTYSVVSKSDSNLIINSLSFQDGTIKFLKINWSYAVSNNSFGNATATIRATNQLGEYSDTTITFEFASRSSVTPTIQTSASSASCLNNGSTSVSISNFANVNNGATGIININGDSDNLNAFGGGFNYNVIHARRTGTTTGVAWCYTPPQGIPITGTIAGSVHYRLTNGNSGSTGGNISVLINGTATTTTLPNLGTFNLSYEEGFLYEILYLGNIPSNITATGLPTGLSIIKIGYRYFIAGNPTVTGSFSPTITAISPVTTTATFSISVLGTPPVLTNPAAGTIPQLTAIVNQPFYGYQPTIQQPYQFPITWSVGGLPPGLSANSSGYISGTPITTGTYYPAIIVNGGGYVDSGNISITVIDPPKNNKRMASQFFDNYYLN